MIWLYLWVFCAIMSYPVIMKMASILDDKDSFKVSELLLFVALAIFWPLAIIALGYCIIENNELLDKKIKFQFLRRD